MKKPKYHLKDEGHSPTYANRLVKAQLQILKKSRNKKEDTKTIKQIKMLHISSQSP